MRKQAMTDCTLLLLGSMLINIGRNKMNKEFRAWNVEEKEMRYTFLIWNDGRVEGYGINDHIIMQYVGKKDINGVKIFEGDIIETDNTVHLSSTDRVRYVVKFEEEVNNPNDYPNTISGYLIGKNPIIIGNIYQNKELLK